MQVIQKCQIGAPRVPQRLPSWNKICAGHDNLFPPSTKTIKLVGSLEMGHLQTSFQTRTMMGLDHQRKTKSYVLN